MYEIIFYEDKNGNSELIDFIVNLKESGATNKTDRINFNKVAAYINVLEKYGTRREIIKAKNNLNDFLERNT